MNLFRTVVALVWVALLIVSVHAVQLLGIPGGNVFMDEFAHPWRAQFNTDLSAHLLLMATWIFFIVGGLKYEVQHTPGGNVLRWERPTNI